MNNIIDLQIKKLVYDYNYQNNSINALESMDYILEAYLKDNPHDLNMWVKRALVLFTVPLVDGFKAIECLEYVLQRNPSDVITLLALAYIQAHTSYIDENLLHRLMVAKSGDQQEQSMLKYAQSWYYWTRNKKIYEQLLCQSIQLCDIHVWNNIDLGMFYVRNDNSELGRGFIRKGLDNITSIMKENSFIDLTSIEFFLNEYVKGTYCSEVNFNYFSQFL